MARRASRSGEGLRQLVIANKQRHWDRWRIDGKMGDFKAAIKSGAAITISGAGIAEALRHAGLDDRQFDHAGAKV